MGIGELLGGLDPSILVSPVALLGLVFLFVLLGWLVPKKSHEQALADKDTQRTSELENRDKQLERSWAEKDALHAAVEGIKEHLGNLTGMVEEVKVSVQATQYAMREIQVTGRQAFEQREGQDS